MRHEPIVAVPPLSNAEIDELRDLLDSIAPPLQPLDIDALDGFLAGVVLQQPSPNEGAWLPLVTDGHRRPLPVSVDAARLNALVRRRHTELEAAVAHRRWFDPWILEPDAGADSPSAAVAGWVTGFAAAIEQFPSLAQRHDAPVIEALALLYRHLDPDDLVDADDLQATIELMEPPIDIVQSIEDLVQATLLLSDVTRPLPRRIGGDASPRRIRAAPRTKIPRRR